jgi:hypothetical protein
MSIMNRLFPPQIDNRYRGHTLALWLLYPITFLNVAIDMVSIFKDDGGAQSADGIPLDTYPPAAAQAVVGVAAYLGLADLLFALFAILALLRYRAMIPLIYLLMVIDYLAHKGIGLMKPIVRAGDTHGGLVTLALFAVSVLGLILSVAGKDTPADATVAGG